MGRETKTGGRAATGGVIAGRYALSVGNPATPLPEGWAWTLLTDVARLESGHTPSRKHPEYWGGDVPWVGITDATSNHGRTIHATEQQTNPLGIANSSARILPAGTVCLSRTASVGYVVMMGVPMATSQDFVNWVCSDRLNPHFLKYILLLENASFRMFSMGTTHQTIYFPEVKAFHIALPSRKIQDKIVEVVSAFDEKIESNLITMQACKAVARTIFRDWFVDYGPVICKAVGGPSYLPSEIWELFPIHFSEGDIPAGWIQRPLDQVASFLNGLALQKYPPDGIDDIPVIKIAQLRNGSAGNAALASGSVGSRFIVNDGDILFSWSGTLMLAVWTGGRGALNQHLFKVTSDSFPKWHQYFWIEHHLSNFQSIAASKATTMGHIQRHHLTEAATVIGDEAIMLAADELIAPHFDLMVASAIESRELGRARDSVIAGFMSGELFVRETDHILAEAA
jgi:type I restriction enzyme S subunit